MAGYGIDGGTPDPASEMALKGFCIAGRGNRAVKLMETAPYAFDSVYGHIFGSASGDAFVYRERYDLSSHIPEAREGGSGACIPWYAMSRLDEDAGYGQLLPDRATAAGWKDADGRFGISGIGGLSVHRAFLDRDASSEAFCRPWAEAAFDAEGRSSVRLLRVHDTLEA